MSAGPSKCPFANLLGIPGEGVQTAIGVELQC